MMRFWLLISAVFPAMVSFADPLAEDVAERLMPYQSFSATFEQQVKGAQGEVISELAGRLALVGQERFRWETEAPFRQLIVADGEVLWVYDPDLEQVQVRPLTQAMNASVASVLSANADALKRSFEIGQSMEGDLTVVSLRPRATDDVTRLIQLRFSKDALVGIQVLDALGQVTDLILNELDFAPPAADEFEFSPPADADVIYALEEPSLP